MLRGILSGLVLLYMVNVVAAVAGRLSLSDLIPFARGRFTTYEMGLLLIVALFFHAIERFGLEPVEMLRDVFRRICQLVGQGRSALAGSWVVTMAALFISQFTLIPFVMCITSPLWRTFASMGGEMRRLAVVVLAPTSRNKERP